MPSRSIKNATRGKQYGPLPAKTAPAPGKLVSNYDGRANTNAGSYQRQAGGETPASGRVVAWDTK
jgi:hypothetical protein